MAENSTIEWTTHTFNPWRGCTKVSDGCKNCYAEQLAKRNPEILGQWGPQGMRAIAAESYWRLPETWNRAAAKAHETYLGLKQHNPELAPPPRPRVFCASLADVFERLPDTHPSTEQIKDARYRLWKTILFTPHLDWLLLTKRIENVIPLLHEFWDWSEGKCATEWWDTLKMVADWINGSPPKNVWLGTSVENQEAADERIPALLYVPAAVRFLSCEPLLGPITLKEVHGEYCEINALNGDHGVIRPLQGRSNKRIHWVIAGGESGAHARPMYPDWVRTLRDQCQAAGVPFFFKQWGEFGRVTCHSIRGTEHPKLPTYLTDSYEIVAREDDQVIRCSNGDRMARVGKKAAGRSLDGREWNEFPEVAR